MVATARSQCQSAMRADLAALLSTASHDRALAERGALVVYSLVALSEAELGHSHYRLMRWVGAQQLASSSSRAVYVYHAFACCCWRHERLVPLPIACPSAQLQRCIWRFAKMRENVRRMCAAGRGFTTDVRRIRGFTQIYTRIHNRFTKVLILCSNMFTVLRCKYVSIIRRRIAFTISRSVTHKPCIIAPKTLQMR